MLWVLFFVIIFAPLVIIYRNLKFKRFFKLIFTLFFIPIFFAGLALNLLVVEVFAPGLFDIHNQMSSQGSGRYSGPGLLSVLMAFPMAFFFSYLWYKFVRFLDHRHV